MERFGTEQSHVLLSVQHALAMEHQRKDAPGPWEAVWVPALSRALSATSGGDPAPPRWPEPGRQDVLAEPVLPWNEAVMDPETGAGTIPSLRRDLELEPPESWLMTIAIEPMTEIRSMQGDEIAGRVLRAVAEVVPFALRARDRVYRTGQDELALLLRDAEEDGAAAAASRLEAAAARALTDRRLPAVFLSIRPLDLAGLDRSEDLAPAL
jgi:GGDEF domain-containing protein